MNLYTTIATFTCTYRPGTGMRPLQDATFTRGTVSVGAWVGMRALGPPLKPGHTWWAWDSPKIVVCKWLGTCQQKMATNNKDMLVLLAALQRVKQRIEDEEQHQTKLRSCRRCRIARFYPQQRLQCVISSASNSDERYPTTWKNSVDKAKVVWMVQKDCASNV